MEEKTFLISQSVADHVLQYLISRPYYEVAQMVAVFQTLQEAPKPCQCPPKKEDAILKNEMKEVVYEAPAEEPKEDKKAAPPLPAMAMMGAARSNNPCVCNEDPCICGSDKPRAVAEREAERVEEEISKPKIEE